MALPRDQGDRLTELGWEQARAAAPHLAGIGATRILTSPLRRARETAEALAEVLELPVVEVEDLRELRESEGFDELSLEDQRLRRWSVWMTEHGDDPNHSYRGGETFNQVLGRVRSLQQWLLEQEDENILAVSQLGTFNCGLSVFAHGDPPASNGSLLPDETGRSYRSALESSERPRTNYAGDAWRCLTWMERLPPR